VDTLEVGSIQEASVRRESPSASACGSGFDAAFVKLLIQISDQWPLPLPTGKRRKDFSKSSSRSTTTEFQGLGQVETRRGWGHQHAKMSKTAVEYRVALNDVDVQRRKGVVEDPAKTVEYV